MTPIPNPPPSDPWLLPVLQALLAPHQLEALHGESPRSYWTAIVRAGLLTDDHILNELSRRTGIAVAPAITPSAAARETVAPDVAQRYHVVPLAVHESTIEIATANPYDLDAEHTIAFLTGKTVRLWLATPHAIATHLALFNRPAPTRPRTPIPTPVLPPSPTGRDEQSIITLVDHIISSAISERASDIHIETEETGIAVRYRVDGVLRHIRTLPVEKGPPVVSRIKIMAQMDIANRLRPQGGRTQITLANGISLDLRVSTLPATLGEKVVIRLLDGAHAQQSFDTLGFDLATAKRIRALLETREGLILVTGPTGSGKTTTLYAALQILLHRGLNVVTVEDPVEYRIPGMVQVQINEKAGLTFASALRSILRQDPDVILVGEVRDAETAGIAIQAAMTGHLVFATLHTIDACSSITRLQDLGVEPAKLTASLKGIVAQRLVRKVCDACVTYGVQDTPVSLWDRVPPGMLLAQAGACETCGHTGYRGRMAAAEVVLMSPALSETIGRGATTPQLVTVARQEGTPSLWASGVTHLLAGQTTFDELRRVLAPDIHEPLHAQEPPGAKHDQEIEERASSTHPSTTPLMPAIRAGVIDLYIVDPSSTPWRVLVLQRAPHSRCPGAWEAVHGFINEGERADEAALRELREETGLACERLYNITVHAFYLHQDDMIQLATVFCAFVDSTQPVRLGEEFSASEWLPMAQASERFLWPRAVQALREIERLLHSGDAGPAEDVLRVR